MLILDVLAPTDPLAKAGRAAGKQDEGQPIEVGMPHAQNRTSGTGAHGSDAHPWSSGQIPVRRGHDGRRPRVLRGDERDAARPGSLDQVEAASLAGHAVDTAHPRAGEEPHNNVGRFRHCRFLPLGSRTPPAFLRHQQNRVLGAI
jgi:hypothetical protein